MYNLNQRSLQCQNRRNRYPLKISAKLAMKFPANLDNCNQYSSLFRQIPWVLRGFYYVTYTVDMPMLKCNTIFLHGIKSTSIENYIKICNSPLTKSGHFGISLALGYVDVMRTMNNISNFFREKIEHVQSTPHSN